MFVLAEFLKALTYLISTVFSILSFLLIIRILLSWFPVDPYNPLIQTLYRITEPILAPFRRLPLQVGMIDFSVMVAYMVLWFVRNFIVGVLIEIVNRIG